MQITDITVAANGARFVAHMPGRYIKYVSGTAGGNDTGIIVRPGNSGDTVTLYPGQAFRVSEQSPVPDSWSIQTLLGQGVITGKVMVGNGIIYDNSLTGVVQVVDGGKSRTLAGSAFSGFGYKAAVASQYGRLQLWNPAASGKRLVVENLLMLADTTATASNIVFLNTQLATLVQDGFSKMSGGPVPAGLVCSDSTLTALAAGTSMLALSCPLNSTNGFTPHEPYVVTPGYGLVVYASTVNADIGMTFEWYEEPNV